MNFRKELKELKWQSVLYAAIYMVLGVILLLFPATTAKTMCYLVGGTAIAAGVVTVLVYLFRNAHENSYRNDFVNGLIGIMIGIFIFYKAELIISLIPFLLGIFIVISGFIKLQSCIDVRMMGYGNGLAFFILAVINIVFGILLVANPAWIAKILFQLIGAGLLFSGITDMVTALYMLQKVKSFSKDMEALEEAFTVEEVAEEKGKEQEKEQEKGKEQENGKEE